MSGSSTQIPRPTELRLLLAICLCSLVLVGSLGVSVASQSATVTYDGSLVTRENGTAYLWYSSPFRASVTVPDAGNVTGVCLSYRRAYGNSTDRIECAEPTAPSNGSATARFGADHWPARTAGKFDLVVSVRREGNETRQVHTERVVVIRKGGDIDGDGLANVVERDGPTNFTDPDTDDDGLLDGAEVKQYNTSPVSADTDDDGLRDGVEVMFGTDPTEASGNVSDVSKMLGVGAKDDTVTNASSGAQADEEAVPDPLGLPGKHAFLPGWKTLAMAAVLVVVALLHLRNYLVAGWQWLSDPFTPDRDRKSVQSTDGGVNRLPPDEAYVIEMLERQGGRVEQAEIVERSTWSKAKVSRVLSRLEASDRIEKEHVGRRNVIVLTDEE